MSIISNPFIANVARQMSNEELAQAIRVDIAGELEAIIGYEAHAMSTSDQRVQKILRHIADDERTHIGELQQLLSMLSPKETGLMEKGRQNVQQQHIRHFQQPTQ